MVHGDRGGEEQPHSLAAGTTDDINKLEERIEALEHIVRALQDENALLRRRMSVVEKQGGARSAAN